MTEVFHVASITVAAFSTASCSAASAGSSGGAGAGAGAGAALPPVDALPC